MKLRGCRRSAHIEDADIGPWLLHSRPLRKQSVTTIRQFESAFINLLLSLAWLSFAKMEAILSCPWVFYAQ